MKKALVIQRLKTVAFLIMGIGILGFFTYIATNNAHLLRSTTNFKIQLENAEGLFSGSIITINGVEVGNVSGVDMGVNQIVVHLNIRNQYTKFININSIASPKRKGLLGDKYIAITTEQDGPLLKENSFISVGESGGLMDLGGNNDLVTELTSFLKQASAFLEKIQAGPSSGTNDIKGILKHLKSILRKIDHGQGSVGKLINDKKMYEQTTKLLQSKPSGLMRLFLGGGSSDEDE